MYPEFFWEIVHSRGLKAAVSPCWIHDKSMVAGQGTESPEAQKIQDSKMTYF